MLTAKTQEAEKILGLELGADDYVTKPFSPRELRARIKAVLRRFEEDSAGVYRFGDCEVDFDRAEIRRGGRPVDVTALEFRLLQTLIRCRGRVLTREQLIEHAWGPGTYIGDRVVDTHILNLRKKIEAVPAEPQFLLSVRGLGYRFDGVTRRNLDTRGAEARHDDSRVENQGEPLMTRHARTFLAIPSVVVLLAGGLVAQKNDPAAVMLRTAIDKAQVDGDLSGAIKQYQRIVDTFAKTDRAIVATALVRMAECYQKLGDAQAKTHYERVVREFADQKEAVTLALARLGAKPAALASSGDRVVKAGDTITYGEGRISPDGRLISYVDHHLTGNLMLHDLANGTDRALTTNKDWCCGSANSSAFSPDGKQIAFGWGTFGKPPISELRVIRIDATGLDQSRRIATSDDVHFYNPTDWSADGKWLAMVLTRRDRAKQIGVISVQDGSFRSLKTTGWRGANKVFFSPDGKYLVYDLPASDSDAQRDVFIIAADGSRETRVVEHSANDVVMAWTADGTRVLFASDRTGEVGLWALPVADGKPSGAPVLLKPNIGTVSSFGLTASGVMHILRDAGTLGLHVAPIDLDAGRLIGAPVLESFRSFRADWSADGKQLAYPLLDPGGRHTLAIRSDDGRRRELRPQLDYFAEPRWVADGRSLMTGGRDFQGRAGIYRVDAETGQETFIAETDGFGGAERVQASPDGRKIYYTVKGNSVLVERDLASGVVRTLFEPRVRVGALDLSPDGRSILVAPIDWESKTSALVLIPVAGGEPRTLFQVSKPDAAVSTYGWTSWTGDSKALLAVTLGERSAPKELWLVPVTGEPPRKLDVDVRPWMGGGIRLHPSGKQIAFFLGSQHREVWALESLRPVLSGTR